MSAYQLPESSTKRHMAILGMNGSGKTSVAKAALVEPALIGTPEHGEQRVCIIDPTGVWWGLRLFKNGKTKAFQIYIVGGEHADFPINVRDGATWGEIVGTSSDPFIFDVSMLTGADRTRWFTAFAENVIRKNKGPLNLVIDEAHLFAPQGGASAGGLAPDMLHATNNLLALGRSKGLRVTMITQRPAKLHKDALSQAHTLIAMRVTAPQDRKAIKEWVQDQTDAEKGAEIIASLPTLKPGEGWVWAPSENILERVTFPWPKTYDSSAAPEEMGEAIALPAIDPAAITEKLKKVAADAATNDPAKLKAEIARLQMLVKNSGPPLPDEGLLLRAKLAGGRKIAERAANFASVVVAELAKGGCCRDTREAVTRFHDFSLILLKDTEPVSTKREPKIDTSDIPEQGPEFFKKAKLVMPHTNGGLPGPEQQIIDAIAWWLAKGVTNPSPEAVAMKAGGRKARGGSWNTYLSRLRTKGLLQPGSMYLTQDGVAAAHHPASTPNGAELREEVLTALAGPLRERMEPILSVYPEAITPTDLADRIGKQPQGGSWNTYLSRLRSYGLIERGQIKAADWLFP